MSRFYNYLNEGRISIYNLSFNEIISKLKEKGELNKSYLPKLAVQMSNAKKANDQEKYEKIKKIIELIKGNTPKNKKVPFEKEHEAEMEERAEDLRDNNKREEASKIEKILKRNNVKSIKFNGDIDKIKEYFKSNYLSVFSVSKKVTDKQDIEKITQKIIEFINCLENPKKIKFPNFKVCKTDELNENGAIAQYNNNSKVILLSKFISDKRLQTKNAKTNFVIESNNGISTILHEMGHYFYFTSLSSEIRENFKYWKKEEKEIASEVSKYAQSEPFEFIAETFAGLSLGYKYSPKIMELYKKYKGPEPLKLNGDYKWK